MKHTYKNLVVGGTFDLLHEGHKKLLRYAFSLAEHVYVAITSNVYTAQYKPHVLPFTIRKKNVRKFLESQKLFSRATIIPIDTVYGIAKEKNMPLDAILVTEETLPGAKKVNEKRKEVNLLPLTIEMMQRISLATGFLQQTLHMPQALRSRLHKPFGEIIGDDRIPILAEKKLIAVGDVTVKVLHAHGISPLISVIDFMVERKKQGKSFVQLGFNATEEVIHVVNPPSTITPSLWQGVKKALTFASKEKKSVIVVDGEEDLVVLPFLLLASTEYTICYGQPHEGMVILPIIPDTKHHAQKLISSFSA